MIAQTPREIAEAAFNAVDHTSPRDKREIYLDLASAASLVSIAGSLERLANHVTGAEIPDPDDDGTPAVATVVAYAREHGITPTEALAKLTEESNT